MTTQRIAIVQEPPAVLNLQEGISRAVKHIHVAAKEGARLVAFPETWLTGYPSWVFAAAGWDDVDARHWYGRLLEESATVDGEDLLPIREAARKTETVVSLGLNERARVRAGSVYNSVLLIGHDGNTLNLHRKLTPTHTERIIWAEGDASGLRVSDTLAGRVGTLICWENWHPMARQALHFQDEQIHIASWPDMSECHSLATRHYAFEGRCFVIGAAQYLTTADVPDDLVELYRTGFGPMSGEVLFDGGSGVVGPDGNWVVEQVYDRPGLIYADIDLAETARFKHDLDVVGHYSRPDIFQLMVDRSVREAVVLKDNSPGSSSPTLYGDGHMTP